jgi:hypothetical protein
MKDFHFHSTGFGTKPRRKTGNLKHLFFIRACIALDPIAWIGSNSAAPN